MSLLDADLGEGRRWAKVGDGYAVTKKPRSLDRSTFPTIPFAAMEAIPQGGAYLPDFAMKPGDAIVSGTYFERGDVLVGKITPSFENGKQALIQDLPAPFGYATTEVIPLHPISDRYDPRFLFFYLLHPDVRHYVAERMEGSTGRQRVPEYVLLDLPIPDLEPDEQKAVADAIETLHMAISAETACEERARDLKRAAMRALFTKGLRAEAQKETEIGPVPESWATPTVAEAVLPFRFDRRKQVAKSAYGEVGEWPIIDQGQQAIAGFTDDAEKIITPAPPIIIFGDHTRAFKFVDFPFALGADGTKPLLAREGIDARFLFQALCALDVPSRGYNRHYTALSEMCLPMPSTQEEQREIVAILDAIDRKIDLHRRKRTVLDELFKALLHRLMTGEIRVSDLDLSALSSGPVPATKQTPEVAA